MRLSLKTKLRFAILSLVLGVTLAYSFGYITFLTRYQYEWCYEQAQDALRRVNNRTAFTLLQAASQVSGNNLDEVRRTLQQMLTKDQGLQSFVQDAVSWDYTIADVALLDENGRVLLHSEPGRAGTQSQPREDLERLLSAGIIQQLRVAYFRPRVYKVSMSMVFTNDQDTLGWVEVGVDTSRIPHAIVAGNTPLTVVGVIVILALIMGWVAAGLMLQPLDVIRASLDRMTQGQFDALPPAPAQRSDEFGAVASKLTLLGQQFRDARESMAQVLHGLEEALLLFTRDGRAILASEKVKEFLSLSPAEILGRPASEVFAAQPVLAERVLAALADGSTIEREEVSLGTPPRPITLSVQFISSLAGGDASGEDQVVLVSLRDVESVRRLESQIELSHRLTAISRLTSGVAHEVKNPLNAMVLHVEAMKSKLSQPSTEESRAGLAEHLEIIAKEVYRLDRVVKTFLDFARPVELRIQETELKPLVEEVLRLAEAEAGPRQVRMVFEAHAPLARVRVDRDLLKQALLNVVLNGCQSMPHGGQLSVSQSAHDGQVEITVADQGVGIPVEIRDKIFNLYFTTREQGSGIGLPLAFRACQLHNGRLDFVSETGRGTTFRIQLPLAA